MDLARRRVLHLGIAAAVSGISLGCRKKVPGSCTDTTGLPPNEVKSRVDLDYRDATAFPDKTCETCQQFVVATSDGGCGTCKILKGPVHPYGYCKSFALKS